MKKPVALIIIGALASIATSQEPPDWTDSDMRDLNRGTIDNTLPSVRYQIHVERHGPGPFTNAFDGRVEVNIIVESTGAEPLVTAELRSLTHPDVLPAMHTLPANQFNQYLALDAFLDCTADPCSEDFELKIHRGAVADAPRFDLTGSAIATISGYGDIPAGTDVTVSVTGPMP